jgi:carboxypeptidase C (cathepsin A)
MSEPSTGSASTPDPRSSVPCLGQGADRACEIQLAGGALHYRAVANWLVLHKRDEPIASMFYIAYFATDADATKRPVTFVFNGGPGAASAYLHMGAVGPTRVVFADDGNLLPPPVQLADNLETWLAFTDVVCVDPIGTGFSRSHEHKRGRDADKAGRHDDSAPPRPSEFWQVKRDLESLGEFISRILTTHGRWRSPIALAGESYGGFRVARMARTLQQDFGIGLNAAILISPGIELGSILGSDYSIDHWVEMLPGFAAAAHVQGVAGRGASLTEHLAAAEEFALGDWVNLLAQGDRMPEARRRDICARASELIGLPVELIHEARGRITRARFCRELLRGQRRYIGVYDGSISAIDPFPDRETYAGPDPTLQGSTHAFAAGINAHLREQLGVTTDLDYILLNMEANMAWRNDSAEQVITHALGSLDDLRYGMALNPDMRVLISHGLYDLATPYASAERLVHLMKLDPCQIGRIRTHHFPGGHMFYTHAESRRAFSALSQKYCYAA